MRAFNATKAKKQVERKPRKYTLRPKQSNYKYGVPKRNVARYLIGETPYSLNTRLGENKQRTRAKRDSQVAHSQHHISHAQMKRGDRMHPITIEDSSEEEFNTRETFSDSSLSSTLGIDATLFRQEERRAHDRFARMGFKNISAKEHEIKSAN